MRRGPALVIVFYSSAAVLVVEIAAGRLMAPYVGVSLETFTGIIGVVLAGIAAGAALGGRLADQYDPRLLLGPSLFAGGVLTWLSVPLVRALGPSANDEIIGIVGLATIGFFAPAVVLSAASPIVAKLRLSSLDQTGSVVGGLSAAGTIGGLTGTFLTGFVFVSLVGTTAILVATGASLVVAGAVVHGWLVRTRPPAAMAVVAIVGLVPVLWSSDVCDVETRYACAEIDVDPDDPSVVSLYLDALHHARVDLDEPERLLFRYIRIFGAVAATLDDGPISSLHIGGGGFTFPRSLEVVRPGSTAVVLEIDPGVVDIGRDHLGLVESPTLDVRVGDARTALPDLDDGAFDLVIGDAFSGKSVPWHLTTVEVAREIDRLLVDDGIYALNVIDGGDSRFARAELATLAAVFPHIGVVLPDPTPPTRPRNQIILASRQPLPTLPALATDDGVLITGDALALYIGDADVLTDDRAPVDQLLPR